MTPPPGMNRTCPCHLHSCTELQAQDFRGVGGKLSGSEGVAPGTCGEAVSLCQRLSGWSMPIHLPTLPRVEILSEFPGAHPKPRWKRWEAKPPETERPASPRWRKSWAMLPMLPSLLYRALTLHRHSGGKISGSERYLRRCGRLRHVGGAAGQCCSAGELRWPRRPPPKTLASLSVKKPSGLLTVKPVPRHEAENLPIMHYQQPFPTLAIRPNIVASVTVRPRTERKGESNAPLAPLPTAENLRVTRYQIENLANIHNQAESLPVSRYQAESNTERDGEGNASFAPSPTAENLPITRYLAVRNTERERQENVVADRFHGSQASKGWWCAEGVQEAERFRRLPGG